MSIDPPEANLHDALVDRLRRGDVSAFALVHAAHHPRLLAFLVRLSGQRQLAEDLAQDTWLRFARRAHRIRPDTRLVSFLLTIARNTFLSHRRRVSLDVACRHELRVAADSEATRPVAASPDCQYERASSLTTLEVSLRELSTTSREVLLLVCVDAMPPEEAARTLDISYAAVRKRLSRARAQLAKRMAERERDPDREPPHAPTPRSCQ